MLLVLYNLLTFRKLQFSSDKQISAPVTPQLRYEWAKCITCTYTCITYKANEPICYGPSQLHTRKHHRLCVAIQLKDHYRLPVRERQRESQGSNTRQASINTSLLHKHTYQHLMPQHATATRTLCLPSRLNHKSTLTITLLICW